MTNEQRWDKEFAERQTDKEWYIEQAMQMAPVLIRLLQQCEECGCFGWHFQWCGRWK